MSTYVNPSHDDIQKWMRQQIELGDFFEPLTGEVQVTALAECAAIEFDIDPDANPSDYDLLFEDSFEAEKSWTAQLDDGNQIYSAISNYERDNDPRFADPFARPDWNGDPNEY